MTPPPDTPNRQSGASATNWPLLQSAAAGGPDGQASLEAVMRRYWTPIYSFVRAAGAKPEDAMDLTQGFIADVLLGRTLLASADARRGRFRTLLRKAVTHYVRDRARAAATKKRRPTAGDPLPMGDSVASLAGLEKRDAVRVFDAQFAAQTVRAAAERTARRLHAEGRATAWTVFERRTLRPQLFGEQPMPYDRILREYGLDSIGQAAHAAIVGRRVFLDELTKLVAETLGPGESLAEELTALRAALESPR